MNMAVASLAFQTGSVELDQELFTLIHEAKEASDRHLEADVAEGDFFAEYVAKMPEPFPEMNWTPYFSPYLAYWHYKPAGKMSRFLCDVATFDPAPEHQKALEKQPPHYRTKLQQVIAATRTYEESLKRLREQLGYDVALEQSEKALAEWQNALKKVVNTPAKTVAGMSAKATFIQECCWGGDQSSLTECIEDADTAPDYRVLLSITRDLLPLQSV